MTWHAAFLIGLAPIAQLDPLSHVGSLTEELRNPARIAVAADGTVLVTDLGNDHIARFDSSGTFVGTWAVPEGPIGVAVHPDGRYFVSLRDEGQVAIYDAGFTRIGSLGTGDPFVTFVRPTDIDIAVGIGRIYVVDPEEECVYGFNSDGTLSAKFGERGELPGQFLYPSAIGVDEANSRLILADHDNFRIQIYSTSGIFHRRFGYRMKYLVSGFQEGWTVRTQGVEVDAAGRIYVADALMSTVRIFDQTGNELGKVVEYGLGAGGLRVPCDLALNPDGSRLYVVSTNTPSVEIYATPDFSGLRSAGEGAAGSEASVLDPPGTNWCEYDALRFGPGLSVDWSDGVGLVFKRHHLVGREMSSAGTTDDPMGPTAQEAMPGFDGPHMIDASIICGRCHGITGQPGDHVGLIEGQVTLCMSCHSGGGQALGAPQNGVDLADPFGTNPSAADGRGRSHAWGVAAVNAQADSVGPAPGGQMELYLEEGSIKCTTCHNQHNSESGAPYLRVSNEGDAMCKECHAPRDKGPGEGGTHPVGFDYPSGTGEFPPASEIDLSSLMLKEGKVECMTCHGVHNADSGSANGGAGDGMLLRDANDETLCRTCHSEHAIHDVRGDWQPTCTDCHDVHDPDSANLSLVSREVNGTAVVFTDDDLGDNGLHDFIHSNHDPASYDGICETCHTQTAHHRNSAGGDHDHNAGLVCTDCHTHSSGFLPTGGSCTACHGQPPDGASFPNTAGSHATHMGGVNGPGITSCFVCHAVLSGVTHQNGSASFATGVDSNGDGNVDLAETSVCDACHSSDGALDGANDPVFGAKANWANGVYDGGTLATGLELWCAGCHDDGSSTVNGISAPPVAGDNATWGYYAVGHGRSNVVACTDCHDPTLPHTDGVQRTFSSRFPLTPGGTPKTPAERELDKEAYNDGYRLRRIDGGRALEVPRDTGSYTAEDFRLCLSCHSETNLLGVPANYGTMSVPPAYLQLPAGVAQTNFRNEQEWGFGWFWYNGGSPANAHWNHIAYEVADWDIDYDNVMEDSRKSCVTCHNPHGARDTGGEPTVRMTRGDLDITFDVYNDGSTDYDYGYIASGEFQSPDEDLHCQACHASGQGNDPPGGNPGTRYYREPLALTGTCAMCHGQRVDNGDGIPPGGRRAVIDEFGAASHHLQGTSLDTSDCLVCHDMSAHQQGHVRLRNVDDPDNPSAVIVLDGDPSADQTEAAKLEGFCLACHDDDAANGSVPFSDAVAPPAIDSGAWSSASHKLGGAVGPMTCFGNGETFGCHDTGHGSAKRKLLAPADASQAPVAGDPLREEEGMCYTCHDGWPASSDIESQFALAHHHNVSSVDQDADGSRVECTHCHNPHMASSAALLADPDSGGVWTGTGVDFCLACHDGAPPAGVSFPAAAGGTGYDKSGYPGTTHAALLGPDSCRECHEQHGTAYAFLLKDQYVTTDYNQYSTGDGDYAACWMCHDEDALVQQDNAYGDRHRRHVQGARAPCVICHDTHGSYDAGETGLMSFDFAAQNPQDYEIEYIDNHDASTSFWIDTGQDRGYCYIRCHNKPHAPKQYDRVDTTTVDCGQCHTGGRG